MELYDNIDLIEEVEELTKKGIHKNYFGVLVEDKGEDCLVCFHNPKNMGEFAFAKVEKRYIKFSCREHEKIIHEMEAFFSNINKENHTSLTEVKVKEYDKVELLADKPEYAKENVYKGAHGCVMQPYAIENKIEVEFYNIEGHKYGCVELMVDLEDVKVVE
ncbi:MAG: hypothetical protein IJW47_02580 [Clostridia bacterium]|nr:hypothetical protein [Clostridia bacterium]